MPAPSAGRTGRLEPANRAAYSTSPRVPALFSNGNEERPRRGGAVLFRRSVAGDRTRDPLRGRGCFGCGRLGRLVLQGDGQDLVDRFGQVEGHLVPDLLRDVVQVAFVP